MTQTPAVRVPESMGPKELGSYMRGLREHFKLSQQDVSVQLHIRTRYVAAIEEANYDAMPGKIYARGYVQTYAEFLGLDADQVVRQCFPNDIAEQSKQKGGAAPKMLTSPPPKYGPNWGLIGAICVILFLGLMGYSMVGGEEEALEEETVADVPETLLASVRTTIMPRAQNYECLTGTSILACYFAQSILQQMADLQYADIQQFESEIADAEANGTAFVKDEESDPTESHD